MIHVTVFLNIPIHGIQAQINVVFVQQQVVNNSNAWIILYHYWISNVLRSLIIQIYMEKLLYKFINFYYIINIINYVQGNLI